MQTSIELKRVDLWTLFRLAFFIYGAIGLIVGLFYAFFMALAGSFGESFMDADIPGMGLITGVLGIVLVPVFSFIYGAMGAVVVTIGGAIFNLVTRLGGGIRFDVALVQPAMTAPAPPPYTPPSPSPPSGTRPPESFDIASPPPPPPRYDGES